MVRVLRGIFVAAGLIGLGLVGWGADNATAEGGVAGVGETLRRLEWSDVSPEGDRLMSKVSAKQLPKLEQLERDQWPAR